MRSSSSQISAISDEPPRVRQTQSSGSFEVFESPTAPQDTRSFLLEVVKSHEVAIREEDTPGLPVIDSASSSTRKKARAPTVIMKGTWNKTSKRAFSDGTIMGWCSLGVDLIAEEEGGVPQVLFQATQYFLQKKCYNYPGLYRQSGVVATVNRAMEAFAAGSFSTFDALEATPIDVLAVVRSFLLIVPESPVPAALFYDLLDVCYEGTAEKQQVDVRAMLMRIAPASRAVVRATLDLAQRVLRAQPTALQRKDIALYLGAAVARPSSGVPAETDPQSYAILMVLLELGELAFEKSSASDATTNVGKVIGTRSRTSDLDMLLASDTNGGPNPLEEELKKANEKISSLQRQLEESRKTQSDLKKKLDDSNKEMARMKRRNQEMSNALEKQKASQIMDMY